MTKTIRIVLLLISFAMPALARFGETEAQFASRYGRPHVFHNSRKFRGEDIPVPNAFSRAYEKDGILIQAIFTKSNDGAIAIEYRKHKEKLKEYFAAEERDRLLEVNSNRSTWRETAYVCKRAQIVRERNRKRTEERASSGLFHLLDPEEIREGLTRRWIREDGHAIAIIYASDYILIMTQDLEKAYDDLITDETKLEGF